MFFRIVAGTTILYGVLLLFQLGNWKFPSFSLDSSGTYGPAIMIGLSFGLVAFLNSEFVAQPPLRKAMKLLKEMQSSSQHQPPPELPKAIRRASITAKITVAFLILALVFMVSAGFY